MLNHHNEDLIEMTKHVGSHRDSLQKQLFYTILETLLILTANLVQLLYIRQLFNGKNIIWLTQHGTWLYICFSTILTTCHFWIDCQLSRCWPSLPYVLWLSLSSDWLSSYTNFNSIRGCLIANSMLFSKWVKEKWYQHMAIRRWWVPLRDHYWSWCLRTASHPSH